MKNKNWLIFIVALVLMAGTAGLLLRLKSVQKLGQPGIISAPIPGEKVMVKIDLPEHVLDFTSTNLPESAVELGFFPKDTSFVRRLYQDSDGHQMSTTIVLMGADRTSIHKPDYCLPGQGWHIDSKNVVNVPVGGAKPYQLPVAKWLISANSQMPDGRTVKRSGIYTFWFVTDGEQTPDFYGYLRRLTRNLVFTGVLERWAYVSCYSTCEPGQEDAAFARMEKLISASVPEFQLPPLKR